jgi:hypothetical protein
LNFIRKPESLKIKGVKRMGDKSSRQDAKKSAGESVEILTKPLPEILADMEDNIRAATEAAKRAEEAVKEAQRAEEAAMSISEEATKRVAEARKISEETRIEVSQRTEAAVREAKKIEEVATLASQDALQKAEVAWKASEDTLAEALVKAEQVVDKATEEVIPGIVLKKILASKEFLFFSVMMLVVSVVAAVSISVGLSLLV